MTPDQAYDAGRVARRMGMRRSARDKIPAAVYIHWLIGWDDENAGRPIPDCSTSN